MLHHESVIAVLDGPRQQLALDISSIYIVIFKVPVSPGNRRLCHEAPDLHQTAYALELDELPGDLTSENLIDQLLEILISAGMKARLSILYIFKGDTGIGQRQLFHHGGDRVPLGGRSL